jgi:hypothetical protein
MATPTKVCIFNPVSKLIDIVTGVDGSVVPSTGTSQAGLPVVLNPDGAIDPTLIGTAIDAQAGEAVNSGNLVNLFSAGGVLTMQKAFAANSGTAPSGSPYPASALGFVGTDVALGGTGFVSFGGFFRYMDLVAEFSGVDIGKEVFLSAVTPGGITKARPSGAGELAQAVGYVLAVNGNIVSVSLLAGFSDFAQISGVAQIAQGGTGAASGSAAQHNIFGTQAANVIYAGPSSGPSAFPSFRLLTAADVPSFNVLTPAGTTVSGSKFLSLIQNFSATGNSDIYTCPANKRAIITEITVFNNHATISSTMAAMLKIGGVYYPATASTSILAQSTGSRSVTYILEAGETIAVNMTQQPFNVVVSGFEFDNTSNIRSAKRLTPSLTAGDNTFYTVPLGKTALVLNNTLTMCSGTQGTLTAGNNSGGNITYHFNVVPNGGTPGTTNQMSAPVTVSTGTGSSQSLTSFSMAAGDFISVNLSAGTSDQIAFVTVVEI